MIKEVPSESILTVFSVFKELRPHINEEQFVSIYQNAKAADQFTFYAYYQGGECVGVMGLRYLYDYVHQFHLYVDDLVVTEAFRSQKIGAKLLDFAEMLGREKKCTTLRLCTGIDNESGKRFYVQLQWLARALVFKKKL